MDEYTDNFDSCTVAGLIGYFLMNPVFPAFTVN
jgi:hypothetical protein